MAQVLCLDRILGRIRRRWHAVFLACGDRDARLSALT
jgi:hypothetical protein